MVIVGMILGYATVNYSRNEKRIIWYGTLIGGLFALIMAILKNATNKIDTGTWNLYIYAVTLIVFILFIIFTAVSGRKQNGSKTLVAVILAILSAALVFYAFPDVFAYPFTIAQSEGTAVSTEYILKLIGAILGAILTLVLGIASNRSTRRLPHKTAFTLLIIALAANEIQQIGNALSAMLAKRIIASNHTLFQFAKFTSNYSNLFIYIVLAVALIMAIILWIKSFKQNEPYDNNAELRKIKAKWRNIRRWATTIIVCVVICVITMTVLYNIANQEVELSPIEEATIKDDAVYVSFEQVSDGHLHRFGYECEDGTVIRFIVIQKPNSSAYGIGLDACDICGETGYYEKDGQVVCNLCDVVMNINTIGFKGGCNPIVIDYSIENGYIIVPIEGLVEHKSEFE